MNRNTYQNIQLGLAGASRWLLPLFIIWLLGAVGLGWLVKSLLFLFGLLLITPVIGFFGLRWWLKRNLVQGDCPVCGYEVVGLNQAEFRCPSCSEPLKVEHGRFERLQQPGTIDVQAVDVTPQAIDEA